MAKMFQVLDGIEAINPFDSKFLFFQKNMQKKSYESTSTFFPISICFLFKPGS
jgi:hypothetical protein